VVLLALGSAGMLIALGLMAYGLVLVRIPEHRAALEELIRHETGLTVSFSELSVRWGWYGPEAVFHGVELDEPGTSHALLSAPRLIVSLDLWRMARSGRLEAGRIALQEPDIDLGAGFASEGANAAHPAQLRPQLLEALTRILSRWRGGQIDIEGGTLRAPLFGESTARVFGIRHAQLQRLGLRWSADAQLLLPESLGESARLLLQMQGDPALPELASGSLSFEGRRLEFAGWRRLLQQPLAARYLPQAGRGNFEFRAALAHGRLLKADGTVLAEALEWSGADAAGTTRVLSLERLSGRWQLARRGRQWRLSVGALELGAAAGAAAHLTLDAAVDGSYTRARLQHAPLAALAAFAQGLAPQLPLARIALSGRARELELDWDAQRPAGARFALAADLEDVTLASATRDIALSGFSGHLSGTEAGLAGQLYSHAAQLRLARGEPVAFDRLQLAARVRIDTLGGGWQLSAEELELRRADMILLAGGSISAATAAGPPQIAAHLSMRNAGAAMLAGLLGPDAAAQLVSGRIESADVSWRGPLDVPPWSAPGAQFSGAVSFRDARLRASDQWPEVLGIDARIQWRGARGHAAIEHAQSGDIRLTAAAADWDAHAAHPLRFTGALAGDVQQALVWLRAHPHVAPWAPAVANIDLRGDTRVELAVSVTAVSGNGTAARLPQVRVGALLDGGELHAVAGLPPIGALRGSLVFDGGHLQRSTLAGQWLGGPVSLSVAERREHGDTRVVISGRGVMDARRSVLAAGGEAEDAQLAGSAEWSALLTFLPGSAGQGPHWQLRADSSLLGVASRLPEPFAKPASAALPLHVELSGGASAGQLQLLLGERVRALASLERSGDTWRIERGTLRLAAAAAAAAPAPALEATLTLPADAVLEVEGSVSRLDLPACLALLRRATRDAALPALRAHLYGVQVFAGTHSYAGVNLVAEVGAGGGALQLHSSAISGTAGWPAQIDHEHPAVVRLAGFDIAQGGDAALAAGLAAVFAPAAQISVDALTLEGRALGSFAALLASHDDVLEVSTLTLRGPSAAAEGSARCEGPTCRLNFSLESPDAAAALTAFGLRAELDASHALLSGELRWSPQALSPLATLGGHLHMQLEDGVMRPAAVEPDPPFALLTVPALLAGLEPEPEGARALRFARLAADYEILDGEASTTDLHFDGDAEILVRGQVGLAAGDYDLQAWILRGEDRLPAAVRGLGPTPKVAAAWLSLRELFGISGPDRTRTALRLRGTWNDPIVRPAD
jgi:uncharacterized protein YhdP